MKAATDDYLIYSLLPVIRCFPAAGTSSLDRLQDGICVYCDRIVVFETKHPRELPEELWEVDGWKYFKKASKLRKAEMILLEEVDKIRTSKRKLFGCWWSGSREEGRELRIHLNDGRAGQWFVPESDAEGVRTALSHLAGDRFVDDADLPSWYVPEAARLGRRPTSPALIRLLILFLWY